MPARALSLARLGRQSVFLQNSTRSFSSADSLRAPADSSTNNDAHDIAKLLEKPSWSVASLLSDKSTGANGASEVTTEQLRHLLRLSALPVPADPEEQKAMIDTLHTQLHFVRSVQAVDTTGVEPLRAIRDETREGMQQCTVGIKDVQEALLLEDSYGHNRRPRRRKVDIKGTDAEGWDPLATASKKAGRYIVVDGVEQ